MNETQKQEMQEEIEEMKDEMYLITERLGRVECVLTINSKAERLLYLTKGILTREELLKGI